MNIKAPTKLMKSLGIISFITEPKITAKNDTNIIAVKNPIKIANFWVLYLVVIDKTINWVLSPISSIKILKKEIIKVSMNKIITS